MLTQTLRNLERDGFVSRQVTPTRPPSVSYRLTELGHEFEKTAVGLAKWAASHADEIQTANRAFDEEQER